MGRGNHRGHRYFRDQGQNNGRRRGQFHQGKIYRGSRSQNYRVQFQDRGHQYQIPMQNIMVSRNPRPPQNQTPKSLPVPTSQFCEFCSFEFVKKPGWKGCPSCLQEFTSPDGLCLYCLAPHSENAKFCRMCGKEIYPDKDHDQDVNCRNINGDNSNMDFSVKAS